MTRVQKCFVMDRASRLIHDELNQDELNRLHEENLRELERVSALPASIRKEKALVKLNTDLLAAKVALAVLSLIGEEE